MGRLLRHAQVADTKLICSSEEVSEMPVHSCVIAARSETLASMITPVDEDKSTDKENPDPGDPPNVCLNRQLK